MNNPSVRYMDEREYQERMGSPEMEYVHYLLENPEISDLLSK